MKQDKITFFYNGWNCWCNDSNGEWGAILSGRGEQAKIIDGKRSKEELIEPKSTEIY